MVRGLDCLDGTPLLDLKPDRNLFRPIAPPQDGDFQVGDRYAIECFFPRQTSPAKAGYGYKTCSPARLAGRSWFI